jgi:hypothetical protein
LSMILDGGIIFFWHSPGLPGPMNNPMAKMGQVWMNHNMVIHMWL